MVEPLNEQGQELLDDQTHSFHLSGAPALAVGHPPTLAVGVHLLIPSLFC